MGRKKYRFNRLGINFFAGVLLSSSFVFASFHNIDCVKDRAVLGVSSEECYVLEKLWESTNGVHWQEHEHWDTLTEVSSWDGVRVEEGKISALLLYSNRLKGTIPLELGELSGLKRLALDNNKLSGKIPTSLGNLSKLTYLALNNNRLNGSIPFSFGSYSVLKELYLNNNKLSGNIPSSLGNLNQLMVLKLYENELFGEIPAALGRLSSLNTLSLSANHLTGEIPEELGRLSKLTYLDLKSNKLSGVIPSSLSYLSALTGLYLQENQLEGAIPSTLATLHNLVDLDLGNNKLSGEIPKSLDALENLSYLNVEKNQLSGTISKGLVSLPHLSYFNIEKNHFLVNDIEPILSELKYMPYGYIGTQLFSDSNQTGEKRIEKRDFSMVKIAEKEISNDYCTVVPLIENREMAYLEVDTLKIVGTTDFGESLLVKGEGIWSIGEDGQIIFTPSTELETNPSQIAYTIEDNSGVESEPVNISIYYKHLNRRLSSDLDENRVLTFNLFNDTAMNLQEVEFLITESFKERVENSKLSEDKKVLEVEGEGLWRVEKGGKITFTAEEEFDGVPSNITYLIKAEGNDTIGMVDMNRKGETHAVPSLEPISLFFLMFLSGLLGLFYLRRINEKEVKE